ncbi:hypothetical protein EC973_002363 [Apophysomyces ossiformis]|uniref:Uncharacterized protein n=1 Tax=Apophysomyces ossiformis TaxID=679940 RepID=A0A8H7BKQ2_9FUNG|nr:hypothetical protein EC973_002363 [Apophysomyces ossiformis]
MHIDRFLQLIADDTEGSPVTMRALLPYRRAGALIGIQRSVQFRIQEKYRIRLNFHSEADEFGRLVSVVGRLDNVSRAWREAMVLLFGGGHRLNYGEKLGVNLLIPLALSSKLRSTRVLTRPDGSHYRAQCSLAEIAKLTGATLFLKKDVLPNTTEQVLQVSIERLDPQRLDGFEEAIRMIGDCFLKNRREAFSPRNIYYVPHIAENPFSFDDEENDKQEEEEEDPCIETEWVANAWDMVFCPDELQDDQWHDDFCPDGFHHSQWLDDIPTADDS